MNLNQIERKTRIDDLLLFSFFDSSIFFFFFLRKKRIAMNTIYMKSKRQQFAKLWISISTQKIPLTGRITPLISHELEKTFKTRLVGRWISKPDLVDLLEEIDSFRNETSLLSSFWFQWRIVSDNWIRISRPFLLKIAIF